jgi:hypothetical protein
VTPDVRAGRRGGARAERWRSDRVDASEIEVISRRACVEENFWRSQSRDVEVGCGVTPEV